MTNKPLGDTIDIEREVIKMENKFCENLQYVTLVSLIIAQCVVGSNFYIGQVIYLYANGVATIRNFALGRPTADKVKDLSCLAITAGLILFKFFTNNY